MKVVIPGKPIPQPRPKVCRRGAFSSVYTPDNGIVSYRAEVALRVRAALAGRKHSGPVLLTVLMAFVRPPSHWSVTRKHGRRLKPTAPAWPVDGDCSNYLKGIEDCLNGVAWDDDVQIVAPLPIKYYIDDYSEAPATPFTKIKIEAATREVMKRMIEEF